MYMFDKINYLAQLNSPETKWIPIKHVIHFTL